MNNESTGEQACMSKKNGKSKSLTVVERVAHEGVLKRSDKRIRRELLNLKEEHTVGSMLRAQLTFLIPGQATVTLSVRMKISPRVCSYPRNLEGT